MRSITNGLKRGEYLFVAADCTSCHTDAKNHGAPLAGGPPLTTPFGIFHGPNITPDPRYGIGNWSEADFHRALRAGIGHGGDYLYPVFPFPSFTNLTDRDIADLYAYLRTVKPVAQPSQVNEIRPPFGWRSLLFFWRLLYFREGPLPPGAHPFWDRDEVHDIYAEWRRVFNEYQPPRSAVAEAWVHRSRRLRYASPDGLGQAFNFDLLLADWDAGQFRTVITPETSHRFVLHDRDSIFAATVDRAIAWMGRHLLKTPVRTPRANAFCERLIGTMRRECLDWLIPIHEGHLRWVAP